jgi:hypothetical protein
LTPTYHGRRTTLKSVIVGNGLNIQFGGVAYSSSFIMKRVKYKAKMDGYKELFNNSVTKEDIIGIINGFVFNPFHYKTAGISYPTKLYI